MNNLPFKLSYDIKDQIEYAWLNVPDINELVPHMRDPFGDRSIEDPYTCYLKVMRDPRYFYWTCKTLFEFEPLPIQCVILDTMWHHTFPMLIGSRGLGKTVLLSVYAMLKAILCQGSKIVVVGSGYRQSKLLYGYMENIWNSSPLLRSLCESSGMPRQGPKTNIDKSTVRLGDSIITALPVGHDGGKIRGERSSITVVDEFECLSYDTIIQTDKGLIEIADYIGSDAYQLMNKDGNLETPDKIIKTPLADVYEVIVQNGYSFKCSNIHKVMTMDGWKLAKNLTPDDQLLLDINDYFPSEYRVVRNRVLDENLGWLLGILVSEGTVTNRNYISITNTDRELLDNIKDRFKHWNWKEYYRKAGTNYRGWECKESWELRHSDVKLRKDLQDFGLDFCVAGDKVIPKSIMMSPKNVVISFLSGLFEGDGSAFNYIDKTHDAKRFGMAYYSKSKKMCRQLQTLLLKFGILSALTKRSSAISEYPNWMVAIRGESAQKLISLLNILKFKDNAVDSGYRIKVPHIRKNGYKYVVATSYGNKNVHLGTYDTKQECVDKFNEFYEKAPFVCRVRSVKLLPDKEHLYDFHMPETHSFIGNGFIQHNSLNREIFETVIGGFGVVSGSPKERVKEKARDERLRELGYDSGPSIVKDNQLIISGTCGYDFGHFAEYWRRWKAIIESKGHPEKLAKIFGDEDPPDGFNWKDFAIIRIPWNLLPKGFMDEKQIARAKASIDQSVFLNEYCAVFSKDSNGFFKRSLIEKCTTKEPIIFSNGDEVQFSPVIYGNNKRSYVYGIDPASEQDNFAIVILEYYNNHSRVVYSWTINRKKFKNMVKEGLTSNHNYFRYCVRKIRDLMKVFPCSAIALDSQGGGFTVLEGLHDHTLLEQGEDLVWEVIDEDKEKETDDFQGLHLVHLINFANATWVSEANHGLKKDMENKLLLFPYMDALDKAIATEDDNYAIEQGDKSRMFDSMETCIDEIEELKEELTTIVMTKSGITGRDRWDTPEIKLKNGKKGKLRKDRYSALVMANDVARRMRMPDYTPQFTSLGAVVGDSVRPRQQDSTNDPRIFQDDAGPEWWHEAYT